jgi:hypothetical protein
MSCTSNGNGSQPASPEPAKLAMPGEKPTPAETFDIEAARLALEAEASTPSRLARTMERGVLLVVRKA